MSGRLHFSFNSLLLWAKMKRIPLIQLPVTRCIIPNGYQIVPKIVWVRYGLRFVENNIAGQPEPTPIRPKSPDRLAGWVDSVSYREITAIESSWIDSLTKLGSNPKPRGTSTVPAPATALGKWEVLLREMLERIVPSNQEPVFCDRQLSLHKCAPHAAFVTRAFQLLWTEVTSRFKAPN